MTITPKTGVSLGLLFGAVAFGSGFAVVRHDSADHAERISRLEAKANAQDVLNQKIADDVEHIRETVDRMYQNRGK